MNLRRTVVLWLLVFGPVLPSSATAQIYTRPQVEAMTDAQREAASFLGVVEAHEPGRGKAFRFLVQRSLAEMGYGSFSLGDTSDDQLRAAVSAFQRRIGATVTGDITVGQFDRLSAATRVFNKPTLYLGPKTVTELQGYLSVEGTWTIQGEEHAFPFNRSLFECRKERRTCTEAMSYFSEGSGSIVLNSHLNHYDVVKWAGEEVQIEISHRCVTNTVFINTRTKDVTMMRRPRSECLSGGARLETKLFVLSDGFEVGQELNRKRFESTVMSVMNPDLWRRYTELSR